MFFIQNLFIINLFEIVYSEWIEISQISQSTRSSSEITNNRSLATKNENAFDYSTYKDFLNIIEPKIEFVNDAPPLKQNLTVNSIFSKKLNQKDDFHMIVAKPPNSYGQTGKNQLSMHSSNVSRIKEVFSDSAIDKMVNDKTDATKKYNLFKYNNSKTEKSEQTPNTNENQLIFKHLKFKPFDFNNILKFLSNMQQAFSMNTLTGIGDKVKFLVQFKDSLLKNIG